MALHLKQSTASQSVIIGPFVDDTDGKTAETGLTISNTDIKLSKNGATLASKNSGGGTHDADGYYAITLDATDTNTVGRLQLSVRETGALPVYHEFEVLEEAIYDALYGASATGALPVSSGGITSSSFGAGAINAAAIADAAIDRATFAADTGLQSIRSNTAQAGASGSVTLDASASSTTDFYKGDIIYLTGGTGAGQYRLCTAYNGTTKVATVLPAWATNPDNTSTFAVIPRGMGDLQTILAAAVSTSTAQLGVNSVQAGGTAWGSGAITAASIAADAITAAKIADNAIDAGAIAADAITADKIASDAITAAKIASDAITAAKIATGAITAAKFAADAITSTVVADSFITAAKLGADCITNAKIADNAFAAEQFAADAITAAKLSADVTTELQSGLATAAALDAVDNFVDTEIASIISTLSSIDSKIDTIDNFLDTEIAALIASQIVRTNTAQAGSGTTITLDASASATDDIYNNHLIVIASGTGAGQARFITDYVGATKVATVATWQTNPSSDSVFYIVPFGAIPGATAPTAAEVADAVWDEATAGHTTSGTFGEQLKTDVDAILEDTGTTLQGELDGIQADTEDIQSRLPAALVSGRIDASVGAMANNVMTAAAAAADLTTELQSGLATAAALDAVDNFVDTEVAAIKTVVDAIQAKTDNLPSDPADASVVAGLIAGVDAKIDTIDNFLDTEVAAILADTNELQTDLTDGGRLDLLIDAIKAKTDGLPSDPADQSLIIAATTSISSAIAALNNISVANVLTTQMTESYAANGVAPTLAQALFAIHQHLMQFEFSGTDRTVKRLDGSTTAFVETINSASAPTLLERV